MTFVEALKFWAAKAVFGIGVSLLLLLTIFVCICVGDWWEKRKRSERGH